MFNKLPITFAFPYLKLTVLQGLLGQRLDHMVHHLYPHLDNLGLQEFTDIYEKTYLELTTKSFFFPQACETIALLKSHDFQLAIATNKRRHTLEAELLTGNLSQMFDGSRCAGDTKAKPHPEKLLSLMEEFAVSPSEVIMVGDTTYDIEMSRAAKVTSVAVSHGSHSVRKLSQTQPTYLVQSLSELFLLPEIAGIQETSGNETWEKVS